MPFSCRYIRNALFLSVHSVSSQTDRRRAEGEKLQGGPPLVRYHIEDKGGLISFDQLLQFLGRHGFDPLADPRVAGLPVRRLVGCRPRQPGTGCTVLICRQGVACPPPGESAAVCSSDSCTQLYVVAPRISLRRGRPDWVSAAISLCSSPSDCGDPPDRPLRSVRINPLTTPYVPSESTP